MSDRTRFLLFRLLFFVMQMPIGASFPFLILHMRNELHFSPREISYIAGTGGISIILFQQLWGYIADVLVSKKVVIVFCSVMSGLLFLLVGQATGLTAVFLLMLLFNTVFTPISQILNGFLFTNHGGHARFGLLRAYSSLGFIIVNLGVGLTADKWTGGNLRFIFPVFAVITVFAALLVLPFPEQPRVRPETNRTFLQVQGFFIGRKEVAFFLLIAFFYQAAHSLSFAMQAYLLADMGADMSVISMSYTIGALLELPVFFAANALINRFGEVRLMMFAALVQALRWILVWRATAVGEIILISASHCITFGLFYACGVSYMNKHSTIDLKASGQTLFALVYMGFATVFSNFVGGQVTGGGALAGAMHYISHDILNLPQRTPLHDLYIFCSALAAISLGLCFILLPWEKKLHHVKVLGST